jgi:hypothetical protein
MSSHSRHVRFAPHTTIHQSPSPTSSLSSLQSSPGPFTPDSPFITPSPLPPTSSPSRGTTHGPAIHAELTKTTHLAFDMRRPVYSISGRGLDMTKILSDNATYPPLRTINIVLPSLSGRSTQITVNASRPRKGVTVEDVLHALYNHLQQPMPRQEYESLSRKDQDRVSLAYQDRYRSMTTPETREAEKKDGTKRIDFLPDGPHFLRLTSRKDEFFELETQ